MLTLICQKVKTSRDLDHAHLGDSLSLQDQYFSGQTVHKIWRFYVYPLQRNLMACEIIPVAQLRQRDRASSAISRKRG